jgi:hypothetical protein
MGISKRFAAFTIFGAALAGTLAVFVWQRPAMAASVTVTGTVVDLFCYDPATKANMGMEHHRNGAAGEDGYECAMACAKWEAQPVGLVTADGTLYQLGGGLVANNNAKIAPHVTHTVKISGEAVEEHGIMVLKSDALEMVSK